MDLILAPDVFVNASVALGSPPDQVVQRVLGRPDRRPKTSDWVLARVEAMLTAVDGFRREAIPDQMALIRKLVDIVELDGEFAPGDWESALVATARAAQAQRVLTDHPDLADVKESDGIEFQSTEAWLLESMMPPPPPVG
ncbi:MAG TPA: hypothetical protein RMF84_20285 [Polyangiaceae bacterium LLY-WYZ-14_1]|nr:hypothetical protein [Polyangiaceae bacterium LLY-WYZ-14_1]